MVLIIKQWTNITDPGDKVALDFHLTDDYESYHGVQATDVLVNNNYVNHEGKANNYKSMLIFFTRNYQITLLILCVSKIILIPTS